MTPFEEGTQRKTASSLFVIGFFLKGSRYHKVILFWVIGVVLSFFIVAKGNLIHDYYQMPLMLPAAFFIAHLGGLAALFSTAVLGRAEPDLAQ